MSNALLIAWIALIGADRIDFAGGAGPFIFTPFLALTPIVAFAELMRRHLARRPVAMSRQSVAYATTVTALLSVVLASVFVAQELPVSASRAFLLVGHVTGTFTVALLASDRRDLARTMAAGAITGLVVFLVFDIAEALWWVGRVDETIRAGTMIVKLGNFQSLGEIPRLPGPVADANRAGFVLLFYGAVIANAERRRWVRGAALVAVTLFLLVTISRSALLGGAALVGVSILTRRRAIGPAPALAAAALTAMIAIFLLASPRVLERVSAVAESPLGQHLSGGRGSASTHLALLERGFDEATESLPRAAIGLGYGNSYLVLQDVFPGNRYGNFHSLYVTMFAESGVFGIVLTLILLFTPIVGGGPWRGVIAGAVLFNIFYQTTSEPVFWFALALAWMAMPVGRADPSPSLRS